METSRRLMWVPLGAVVVLCVGLLLVPRMHMDTHHPRTGRAESVTGRLRLGDSPGVYVLELANATKEPLAISRYSFGWEVREFNPKGEPISDQSAARGWVDPVPESERHYAILQPEETAVIVLHAYSSRPEDPVSRDGAWAVCVPAPPSAGLIAFAARSRVKVARLPEGVEMAIPP